MARRLRSRPAILLLREVSVSVSAEASDTSKNGRAALAEGVPTWLHRKC